MKYFVVNKERKNTVYHEFQKGKFDGKTFWKEDSIFLSDDILFTSGMEKLFSDTVSGYKSYSESEIDIELWNNIKRKARDIGGEVYECVSEADEWVRNTFVEYDVFTVIGV